MEVKPIYVVHGKERRRAADTVAELAQTLLAGADPQLALSSYEGPAAELAEVLDELRTLPFLAERRVVIVKEADPFISAHRERLEAYLQKPCPTGVLLLMAESFPGNTRLAKLAAKIGKVIACEPLKPKELPAYVVDYARQRYNLGVARDAVSLLIDLVGDEAGLLAGELDKLAVYVSDPERPRREIAVADVQALVGQNRQFNVFNVIDAMTAGDVGDALIRFNQMLAQDREAQFSAVGGFAWHVRRLYQARVLLEKRAPDKQILSAVRVWNRPDEFLRQVRQLNLDRIGAMLRRLAGIDLDSKTGLGTVASGLEKWIVEFGRAPVQNRRASG